MSFPGPWSEYKANSELQSLQLVNSVGQLHVGIKLCGRYFEITGEVTKVEEFNLLLD